ncbi:polyprenyl synthetase family protein [Nocardia huaxiensis]|uniref:Polyprenyl synthetase family protein n=1 Tax=Nocardia huaxiensis TaxID=2755382 RepID=A0A7D6ZSW7_9NOCA|nr:polyprenyl synthetase family protein [Nocardia huaxiensis]QLY33125.1 polyprenyl synthetase family protein [Nocardia huaxiensis]UFS93105.1 polyprenyl synthetase family protein [Nocardia huaxiensis]
MSSSTAADPAFGTDRPRRHSLARAARILSRAQQSTRPLLRAAIDTLPGQLRLMAGYHLGWWDADGVPTVAEAGKGLRPALVLAAARTAGCPPSDAVHAAAAVELVHNFTLVHDDIMDGDPVRRGRPTVWRVWGVDDAVLAGDALHSLAVWTLADAPAAALPGIARLEEAVIELCLGQHHDCAFETIAEVSVEQCLETLRHKGSALLGCACALGALCADAPPDMVETLDRFGRELGVAFQLVDDLMGIWGDPARTGKPVGSDLMRHKRSLPVVMALESASPAGRELAELYACDRPLDGPSAARAADLVARAGGKRWAQAESIRHLRAAQSCLAGYRNAHDLLELAECVVHRDR